MSRLSLHLTCAHVQVVQILSHELHWDTHEMVVHIFSKNCLMYFVTFRLCWWYEVKCLYICLESQSSEDSKYNLMCNVRSKLTLIASVVCASWYRAVLGRQFQCLGKKQTKNEWTHNCSNSVTSKFSREPCNSDMVLLMCGISLLRLVEMLCMLGSSPWQTLKTAQSLPKGRGNFLRRSIARAVSSRNSGCNLVNPDTLCDTRYRNNQVRTTVQRVRVLFI